MEEVAAVAENLDGRGALHTEGVAKQKIAKRIASVARAERVLSVAPIEVKGALAGVSVQEGVCLVGQLRAKLHVVIATRPGDAGPVLVGADPVCLGTVIGATGEGGVTRKADIWGRRLQAGDAFKASDAGLVNHVLAIKITGIQKVEERSVVVASQLQGNAGVKVCRKLGPTFCERLWSG